MKLRHAIHRGLFCAVALLCCCFNTMALADEAAWPPAVTHEEAWRLLPSSDGDRSEPLPVWTRMMVTELPKTAAAFLELDRDHRTMGPLTPRLRAAVRYVAARENKCPYAMATSRLDAKSAGVPAEDWSNLENGSLQNWTEAERRALDFARWMTVDSDSISDEAFAGVVEAVGQDGAAAIVLHMAYANFHDRFLQCLRVASLESDALPPVQAKFNTDELVTKTTPPSRPIQSLSKSIADTDDSPDKAKLRESKRQNQITWLPFEKLQERLEQQRKRTTRLPVPSWDVIATKLPQGLMDKPSDIVWYRIAFGYASELAVPFEIYLRTAGAEVSRNWDRIFGNSVFWIVTDAMKCPYCMGHCEMNWEVAGLNPAAIVERSRILAGDDWSAFTDAEQDALAFARKLTQSPSEISSQDIDRLRQGLGDQRALFLMLNASRYNYMTRISNGFQLTLESENVFWSYYNMAPPDPSASK